MKASDDPFGKQLIAAGVCAKTIEQWSIDPQVTYGPTSIQASLFDTLEDLDADKCLAIAQLVHLGPNFHKRHFNQTMICAGGGILIGVAIGVAATKVFKL